MLLPTDTMVIHAVWIYLQVFKESEGASTELQ